MTDDPSDPTRSADPADPTVSAGSTVSTDRIVDVATDLIGLDTRNPPGDVREAVGYVADLLAAAGFETERVVTDPAKPNLLAVLPGRTDRTLLYNGHVDTVPFDSTAWSHDPLGDRDGDRVYGRGATDMKGPLAAMLAAGESIADVSWSVGSYEPVDGPLVDAVRSAAAAASGERIHRRSATGGGDAKTFRHAGVSTVEFAFGTDTVHAVDEYTTREALARNAEVYAALPTTWAERFDER